MSSEPPKDKSDENLMDVDVQDEEVFNDNEEGVTADGETNNENGKTENGSKVTAPTLPVFTKKDKTLHEILEMMEDYYPIVSDLYITYWHRTSLGSKVLTHKIDPRCSDRLLSNQEWSSM